MAEEGQGDADRPLVRNSLIDRIYGVLDDLDDDIARLKTATRPISIPVYNIGGVCLAVQLLSEFDYDRRLGITAGEVAKFERATGHVNSDVAYKLATRARSLLRELEGEVSRETTYVISPYIPDGKPEEKVEDAEIQPRQISVTALRWVAVQRENRELISEISELIDEALRHAKGTNLPPERRALSDIERAQLVAILETALQILKAPLVEKGLLTKAKEAAKEGATNSVKTGTERALGFGLGKLADMLAKFLDLF